ncbi:hypothetical protein [Flavicella sediminum]|uniref:hypothetical protein n=1 Tax=Flavicella sediminum TaxID=2585141 RepID=UPI001122BEA5|nr:hypothetical protein [Flavicella sediminum]
MSKNILIALCIPLSFLSCASDSAEDLTEKTTDPISYTNTIEAIITPGCASSNCHGGTQNPELTSYELVKSAFQSTGGSSALGRIESGNMPKNASAFSSSTINTIKEWIATDFPN